jgi:hypothetical protein
MPLQAGSKSRTRFFHAGYIGAGTAAGVAFDISTADVGDDYTKPRPILHLRMDGRDQGNKKEAQCG